MNQSSKNRQLPVLKITLTKMERIQLEENLDFGNPEPKAQFYKAEYYKARRRIAELEEELEKELEKVAKLKEELEKLVVETSLKN